MTVDPMLVQIQKFSLKGYGVGLLPNGKEVEVPHAVRGDQLSIDWKKKKKGPQKGRILEVLTPSKDRVEPRCPHARICGGCSWQQMDYTSQLLEKEKRVERAFEGLGNVEPILPSPSPFGYRNKMEFSFSENRGGMRYLGLMIAAAEPYVYNLSECHLCPPWFAEAVCSVRSWWEQSGLKAYYPPEDTGSLRYLTLRHSFRRNQKMAILNVSGRPEFAPSREALEAYTSSIQKAAGEDASVFLRIHQANKGKPTLFYEMHLGGPDHIVEELHLKEGALSFKISPSSFFQPNTLAAEKLYGAALEMLGSPKLLFDLYCGTGTLAMAASFKAKQVLGIEISPESVLDAEENLQLNGIKNVQFKQGDVGKVLQGLTSRPDAVIVDPPRAGLDAAALLSLKNLSPKTIVYISCNPLTQVDNIRELLSAGYSLKKIQPIDQFPHTYHIENVALLERNG
jgi:23S rRNA (uracil1939-C5)-methyltransferase